MKEQGKQFNLDALKWLVIAALVAGGVVANYHFSSQTFAVKLVGWIFLLAIVGFIAAQTAKGYQLLDFARESRIEMRKVVWPNRQETTQTTLLVAAVVAITALILWGLDAVLIQLIAWLTGTRG